MQTLLTASAILIQTLLLAAAYYVAERVRLEAAKLRLARERITELEAASDSLRKQIASLRGKFYASKDDPRPDNYPPTYTPAIAPRGHVCENWLAAQNPNDPGWRKARECECDYCLAARRARAQEKRAILEARSSAKPNGSD